jgi:hypothetical protein
LFVFQVQDRKVARTKVTTGYDDGRIVQIVDGLSGGEQVIVSNKGELTEGEAVRTAPGNQQTAPGATAVRGRRSHAHSGD